MALASTLSQLEAVQAAIAAILAGGQSYAIGDRTVTRASLPELYKREAMLLARYRQEQGYSGGRNRVDLRNPR